MPILKKPHSEQELKIIWERKVINIFLHQYDSKKVSLGKHVWGVRGVSDQRRKFEISTKICTIYYVSYKILISINCIITT